MTQLNQVYKCDICGNIVQMMHAGQGELVCCNKPMVLLAENSTDGATEKHVPVIKKTDSGFLVKVGSAPHPMEEKHYIEWIELNVDGSIYITHLKPGDKPEAHFCFCKKCGNPKSVTAREYCNIHGLWKGK
ncbi:MAG TPA: desulfoferrodoxin [Elusimicrobiales bacterium]|nr:desulfoferrodoxin [Elusimicrobiales bacterium]